MGCPSGRYGRGGTMRIRAWSSPHVATLLLTLGACSPVGPDGSPDEAASDDALWRCPDDGNVCTREVRAARRCQHLPVPDGVVCPGGTCTAGVCVAAAGPAPDAGGTE